MAENPYSQRDGAHRDNDFYRRLRPKHIRFMDRINKNIAEGSSNKSRIGLCFDDPFFIAGKGLRKKFLIERDRTCDELVEINHILFTLDRDRNGL